MEVPTALECDRGCVISAAASSVPLHADGDAHAAADAERGAAPLRPQPLHGVQQSDLWEIFLDNRAIALKDL